MKQMAAGISAFVPLLNSTMDVRIFEEVLLNCQIDEESGVEKEDEFENENENVDDDNNAADDCHVNDDYDSDIYEDNDDEN